MRSAEIIDLQKTMAEIAKMQREARELVDLAAQSGALTLFNQWLDPASHVIKSFP